LRIEGIAIMRIWKREVAGSAKNRIFFPLLWEFEGKSLPRKAIPPQLLVIVQQWE